MYKETSDNRILIAYFSATGTTARAAERLAEATGGTLYAIVPARGIRSVAGYRREKTIVADFRPTPGGSFRRCG